MDSDVGAARLRMMRVADTMHVMKIQNSATTGSPGFQQVLEKSGSSAEVSGAGNDHTPPVSGANVQDLMRSESYRYALVSEPESSSEENTLAPAPERTSPVALAAPGGKSSIPRAEDYDSLDSLLAAFGGLSSNPVKAEDWKAYKPESWSEEGFQRKINEMNYRYSLLDKNNLPYGLTRVEDGIARSTDISDTEFEECDGGIMRIDYYSTGDREHHTFIPVMEWEHKSSGGGVDPLVGDRYKMQTPFGFVVKFIRDSSGEPAGYTDDGYENKVNSLLAEG